MSADPDRTPVVVMARRTPIARLDGSLAALDADALAAIAIRGVLDAVTGGPAVDVDDVIVAGAAGPGGNPARRAALAAGLPVEVPGLSIDRQCGGGLDAVVLACRLVQAGAGSCYVAAGAESASRSPLRDCDGADRGAGARRFFPRTAFAAGGHEDPGMAESAEIVARELGVDRDRQDDYAARSHVRAVAADAAGRFRTEILPCDRGDGTAVDRDECLRPGLTRERLGRMPPVVRRDGTVTAGNASQIADGAAACLVVSQRLAAGRGWSGMVLRGAATAGVAPRVCGLGAVPAALRLAAMPDWPGMDGLAEVVMVEAFAAQVLATADALGLDPARMNRAGGAIALGHPWGASGAVALTRLYVDLAAAGAGAHGLAAAAIAGGMGTGAWFEWWSA